jgi:hypothetical protein
MMVRHLRARFRSHRRVQRLYSATHFLTSLEAACCFAAQGDDAEAGWIAKRRGPAQLAILEEQE